MIMVVWYEVAGSRKAVRHLDWPVGSYKRRQARGRAAIMRRDAARPEKVPFVWNVFRSGIRKIRGTKPTMQGLMRGMSA